jgi:hypothetical protein
MKKLLLLFPLLFTLLACNLGVTAFQDSYVTPTVFPQNVQTTVPPLPTFTLTPEPAAGTITGKLSYPSEFIPSMRVAAFSLTDGNAYFVDTGNSQGEYSIDVPAGTYYVVSYPYEGVAGNTGQADSYTLTGGPLAGGYTEMVLCNLYVDCAPHTLIPVTVATGQTVEDVNPGDWYAPQGTYPPMPNP